MALFGLHTPTFGPLHPIIGKLSNSSLSGFTQYYIPFGASDGSLTEDANITWNGSTLDLNGRTCEAGIFRSNNYQSSDGTKSIIYNSGTSRWYVSYNLGVSGNIDASGTLTITGISYLNDKVEFTSSTEYIDQEIW